MYNILFHQSPIRSSPTGPVQCSVGNECSPVTYLPRDRGTRAMTFSCSSLYLKCASQIAITTSEAAMALRSLQRGSCLPCPGTEYTYNDSCTAHRILSTTHWESTLVQVRWRTSLRRGARIEMSHFGFARDGPGMDCIALPRSRASGVLGPGCCRNVVSFPSPCFIQAQTVTHT